MARPIRRTAGDNIRKEREARGWSCADLGRKVGLTRGAISAIEVGRVATSIDTIGRIAKALGVPSSELVAEPPKASGRGVVEVPEQG